jgi:hypothetical protein
MALIGTLGDLKLSDVFRLFATGKRTGLLVVTTSGREANLRFQRGVLVHAVSGRFSGEEAVMDLFGWTEGQLTFVPEEKILTPNVTQDLEALVKEGEETGAAFHRMNELVPHDHVIFAPAPEVAEGAAYFVGQGEWRVLRLADGSREVREIADGTTLTRAEVVRVLFEATEAGLLERVEVQKVVRAIAQGRFGKDAAELDERLLEEWARLPRFSKGVHRIEVRGRATKSAEVVVFFRPKLAREIHLPKEVLQMVGAREGEDVIVRPVA